MKDALDTLIDSLLAERVWQLLIKRLEREQHLRKVLDDILRQVYCDCGNYRHHGVQWMPKGSGEGLDEAVVILKTLLDEDKL